MLALALRGITISFMGWTANFKVKWCIKKVDGPTSKEVSSINDIYGCTPDEL